MEFACSPGVTAYAGYLKCDSVLPVSANVPLSEAEPTRARMKEMLK